MLCARHRGSRTDHRRLLTPLAEQVQTGSDETAGITEALVMMAAGAPRRVGAVSRCWTAECRPRIDSRIGAQTGSCLPASNLVRQGSDMSGGWVMALGVGSQGANQGRRPRGGASPDGVPVVWERLDLRIDCQDMQSRGSASPDLRDRDKTCGSAVRLASWLRCQARSPSRDPGLGELGLDASAVLLRRV